MLFATHRSPAPGACSVLAVIIVSVAKPPATAAAVVAILGGGGDLDGLDYLLLGGAPRLRGLGMRPGGVLLWFVSAEEIIEINTI